MADAADSKSAGGDFVRVQVPPPASGIVFMMFYIMNIMLFFLLNNTRNAKILMQ